MVEQIHDSIEKYSDLKFGSVEVAKYLSRQRDKNPELDDLIKRFNARDLALSTSKHALDWISKENLACSYPEIDTSFMSESISMKTPKSELLVPRYIPLKHDQNSLEMFSQVNAESIYIAFPKGEESIPHANIINNFAKGFECYNSEKLVFKSAFLRNYSDYKPMMQFLEAPKSIRSKFKHINEKQLKINSFSIIPDDIVDTINQYKNNTSTLSFIVKTEPEDWQLYGARKQSVFDEALLVASIDDKSYLVDHFKFKPLKEEFGSMYNDFMKENEDNLILRNEVR